VNPTPLELPVHKLKLPIDLYRSPLDLTDACVKKIKENIFAILQNAIVDYPSDMCLTEIVNFQIVRGTLPDLNYSPMAGGGYQTETFAFMVRVTNKGDLAMKNVKVRVSGREPVLPYLVPPTPVPTYALVGLQQDGEFETSIYDVPFDLPQHASRTRGPFFGLTNAATNGAIKPIVAARIMSWDASLDFILLDSSGRSGTAGTLDKEIKP
jgi:hypothetical protein